MSAELVLIVILTLAVAGLAIYVTMLLRSRQTGDSGETFKLLAERLSDFASVKARVDGIASTQERLSGSVTALETALKGVETKLVETSGSVKESILKDFGEARRTLVEIKTGLDERKKLESDLQESTRRIEAVIVGSRERGQAGENILEQALKEFPPSFIEKNFKVKNAIVEYALVLANQKRVPIDSKWPASDLLTDLETEPDLAKREAIVSNIEQKLRAKVKEVTKYIDPARTMPLGIAAVPDSVFNACPRVHAEAFKDQVVVMPYSMTVIYLLSLYQLHMQYCGSVDMEKLEGYVAKVQRDLDKLDKLLANSLFKGSAMISNALNECQQLLGEMRSATTYLKSLPGEQLSLEGGQTTLPDIELPPSQ